MSNGAPPPIEPDSNRKQPPPQVVIYTPQPARWRRIAFYIFLLFIVFLFASQWLKPFFYPPGSVPLSYITIKDEGAPQYAALIQMTGLLYGGYVDVTELSPAKYLHSVLDQLRTEPQAVAVLLRIDSPGGEIMAVDQMFNEIMDFQRDTGKPVIAFLDGIAASGGYYIAAACRWILARPLTITGSIGVILHTYNYRQLMDKIGIRPEVYKSGRFKDLLRGDRSPEEVTPEERKLVQDIVDQCHAAFLQRIEEGRGYARKFDQTGARPLSDDWKSYADGRILLGSEAYEIGFVDELGDFEDAWHRVKLITGQSRLNLVEYRPAKQASLLEQLLGAVIGRNSVGLRAGLTGLIPRPGTVYAIWPEAFPIGRE